MDSKNAFDVAECYRLLALCARAEAHQLMDEQIKFHAVSFTMWKDLPVQAELHGMAPLLRYHLKRLDIPIPSETKQILDGLYLRHRSSNQTQTQILIDVTSLFEKAGIRALVIKGLALAYEYYPDPALRPGNDIDLLLKTEDVMPALEVLRQAGFRVQMPSITQDWLPKEFVADSLPKYGFSTRIEIHHYDPRMRSDVDNSLDDEFSGFNSPYRQLNIGETIIHVPDPMDMINYLFRHLIRHMFAASSAQPLQLKWIADIVNLVERHAVTIDWGSVKQQDPALLKRLEVIYSSTPMPERLKSIIPIQQGFPPAGVNQYPQGWPQIAARGWNQKGALRNLLVRIDYLWQTLKPPSPWWLQLQYGVGAESVLLYGQLIYRFRILKMAIQRFFRNFRS